MYSEELSRSLSVNFSKAVADTEGVVYRNIVRKIGKISIRGVMSSRVGQRNCATHAETPLDGR
ncbi:MAG: hypothetical protein ACP5G0_06810 [Desulfomonilia bacterium]